MRMPKGFNKWSANEQASFLVKKLQEFHAVESEIAKMLAKIRGGQRLEFKEIERPDEAILKS
jgi:hypothetical protein